MPANISTVTSMAITGSLAAACRDVAAPHWRRVVTIAWSSYRQLQVRILRTHAAIDWDNDVPPLPFLSGEIDRANNQRGEGDVPKIQETAA